MGTARNTSVHNALHGELHRMGWDEHATRITGEVGEGGVVFVLAATAVGNVMVVLPDHGEIHFTLAAVDGRPLPKELRMSNVTYPEFAAHYIDWRDNA